MTGSHPDIEPELRQLAQGILDRLDPAVRVAAARLAASSDGKCEQVWCPVCALAALITGEKHPLLTVVADHSVALMAVLRAMVESIDTSADTSTQTDPTPHPPPSDDPTGSRDDSPPQSPGRYEHIPVTVED